MFTSPHTPAPRRRPGPLALFVLAQALACSVPAGAEPSALAQRLAALSDVTRFTPERALPQLQQLAPEARSSAPATRGEFLGQLCLAYYKLGRHDQASAACDELIDYANRLGDARLQAEGMLLKAYVEFALNRPASAHRLVWDAERLAANAPDIGLRVRALISSGQSHAEENDFRTALQRLQDAATLAQAKGTPTHVVMAQNALALLYGQLHEADKAFAALAQADAAGTHDVYPARVATARVTEANLAAELGQYERAVAALQAALALERDVGADGMAAATLLKLSDGYLKLNDYRNAAAYAQQALEAAHARHDDKLAAAARVNLSQATPNGYERRRRAELLDMEERYEADKRTRMIDVLRRENALKSAEIANRGLQQRLWASALCVITIAALVVGFAYRRVRQANAALRRTNLELKRQSERDPLTGAYNRRYFQKAMRADRAVGGLFLIDVDHFKQINDQHGHAAGDAVLKVLAKQLRALVGEDGVLVRWGGEEFLAYVPSVAPAALDDVARRLLAGVAGHTIATPSTRLSVTISMGYAPLPLAAPGAPLPWERVLHLLDMALYLAKARGRNRGYGMHRIAQADRAALERIERDLEAAWREGLVELALVTVPSGLTGMTDMAQPSAHELPLWLTKDRT